MGSLLNIIKQFFINNRSIVLMTKIIRRFKKKSYNKTKMKLWMDENKISLEGFLKNIDYDLWVESTMVNNEIKNHSKKRSTIIK